MQSLWMIAASLLFASMGVCVKLGAGQFSAAELVFYRGFISLVLVWAYIRISGLDLRTQHRRGHVQRGLAGFVSLVLYFYAISVLPLATAVALNYTSPLFLAAILALWAGERPRPTFYLALVLGLAGVTLLLRPSFAADQWLGGLAAVGSGASAGVAYYNVRQLGSLGEPEWRTVYYFSLVSALGGLPWALASNPTFMVGWYGGSLLLGIGVFGALAQLAMTRAYKHGHTLVSASLAYSTVVFSSVFGMILWDEMLPASSWIAIGLIVASGLIAVAQSRDRVVEPE